VIQRLQKVRELISQRTVLFESDVPVNLGVQFMPPPVCDSGPFYEAPSELFCIAGFLLVLVLVLVFIHSSSVSNNFHRLATMPGPNGRLRAVPGPKGAVAALGRRHSGTRTGATRCPGARARRA
jgi:hypothetical protein